MDRKALETHHRQKGESLRRVDRTGIIEKRTIEQALERVLTQWPKHRDLLQTDVSGSTEAYFLETGGTSLEATQLVHRMAIELGIHRFLSYTLIYTCMY